MHVSLQSLLCRGSSGSVDKFKRYDVNLGISLDRDILFGDYANFCSMKKESSWFLLHMNQFIHLHDSSYSTSYY